LKDPLAAIGLFGGTFDPIHFGHLRLATELAETFRLERVVFLHPEALHPAHQPGAAEDAHQVVLQRQVEARGTGIALAP